MAWDNGGPCAIPVGLREFDVASALRDFVEAGREKPSPHFAERQLLSDTRPQRNCPQARRGSGDRRAEMQRQGVAQILQSGFLAPTLAGEVDLQALGDPPSALAPYAGGELLWHAPRTN